MFGDHHALSEAAIAKIAERVENLAAGRRPGDDFDKFQVARRIEKVRPGPVLLKIFRKTLGDQADGEAGGVGGDDGAGLAMREEAREQFSLDLEVLRHGFDNPIGAGAESKVVVKIPNAKPVREGR